MQKTILLRYSPSVSDLEIALVGIWLTRLLLMDAVYVDTSLQEESKDWAKQKVFIFWDKKPLMVWLNAVRWAHLLVCRTL